MRSVPGKKRIRTAFLEIRGNVSAEISEVRAFLCCSLPLLQLNLPLFASFEETCVSDFGIGFDIWWLFTLLNHLSLLCLGLYFLRQRQIEIKDPNASAKKKKIR